MKRYFLLTAILVSFPWVAQAGETYRWLDSRGVMHYSDTPPPKSEQAEIKRFSGNPVSDEALSFETRRAKQNFPVSLYVSSGCGDICDQARSLLSKRGIPFSEKELKTKEDFEQLKQLSGTEGLPVLAVGKNYLKGFVAEQWNGELDIAGYPKTAPYRAPATIPTPDSAGKNSPVNEDEN